MYRTSGEAFRIGYFVKIVGASGGIKVVTQHVRILRELGVDACLIARRVEDQWDIGDIPLVRVSGLDEIPPCRFYVGTFFSDVQRLFERFGRKVVHLCQAYEPTEYGSRIAGASVPERYRHKGVLAPFKRRLDVIKFKRRARQIEAVYALPTVKAAVSRHLADLIEARYGGKCSLIANGVDDSVFRPGKRAFMDGDALRLVSVGSPAVGFKGIPDTMEAVRLLKARGLPVKLIRVSPSAEKADPLVDELYSGLKEEQMAELYRQADVFISSSLEGEGFGLPAIEAMACAVPSVLTTISSYMNFDENRDFALFVPTGDPEAIAAAVARLMEDAGLRQRLTQRGLEVAARHTLSATKADLAAFIDHLQSLKII